jgi:hypothetical protein
MIAVVGLSALLPAAAFALQSRTYDVSSGALGMEWKTSGRISAEKTPAGLVLSTGSETGTVLTDAVPSFFPEAATVVLSADSPGTMYFTWNRKENPARLHTVILPYGTGNEVPLSFSLRRNQAWHDDLLSFGITLPPNTAVMIHGIDFLRWSYAERMAFMAKSFFVFDDYRPYSINFVWGPLLAMNPIEAGNLYQALPPQQLYAMELVNLLLVLGLVLIAAWHLWKSPHGTKKRRIVVQGMTLILMLWIAMDLRMGSEFLAWVIHDHETYIGAPSSTREFRDRGRFYDFGTYASGLVSDRDTYVFLAQQQWPYLGNMRYLTYPAIPGFDIEQDDTWVIYDRPDIAVNAGGQIAIDGEPLTPPGRILGRFDETSFVFRISAP